jgi:hypothetical protein
MRSRSNDKVRRSASEWREILHRFEKSQLSPRAFCKRESLGAESFRRWRIKLAADPIQTPQSSFVPLTREEGFPAFWSLEIDLPDGRTVRIRG